MRLFLSLIILSLLFSCQQKTQENDQDLATGDLEKKLQEKKDEFRQNAPQEIIDLYQGSLDRLEELGLPDQALKIGDTIPDFEISYQGERKKISEVYKNQTVILTFYRGGWCPYCMIQLQEYEKAYPKFKDQGAELIALAPDKEREIQKTKSRFELTFPIHSDLNHEIARQFGIVFQIEPEIVESYKSAGVVLEQYQGNDRNELPLGATYIINKEGQIIFSFVEVDYTIRAEPSDLLEIL